MPSNKDPSLLQVSYGRLNVEQLPLLFREQSDRILNAVDNEVGVLAEGKTISLMSTQVEHVVSAPAAGSSTPLATATEIRDVAVVIPNSDVATISPLIYRDAVATAAGSSTSQASAGNVPKDIQVFGNGSSISLASTQDLVNAGGTLSGVSSLSPANVLDETAFSSSVFERGLWRAPYGGLGWRPSVNKDYIDTETKTLELVTGSNPPGIGTAVNGKTPAVFTNTNQTIQIPDVLTPTLLYSRTYVGGGQPFWQHTVNFWLLVRCPTAPNANICYMNRGDYSWYINIGSSNITFNYQIANIFPTGGYHGLSVYHQTLTYPYPGNNQWMLIQWAIHGEGDCYLQVNGNAVQSAISYASERGSPSAASLDNSTAFPLVLGNTNSGMQVLEFGIGNQQGLDTFPNATASLYRIPYLNARYGLSL